MNPDDVSAANVSEQRANCDRLWRDGDIDTAALHEVGVRRLVDQRHDLVRTQALGQHRRQNVGLLRIGEGREDIGAVDILLDQQLLIRSIAVEHDGVLEQLRGFACAPRVALYQLYLTRLLQRLGEPQPDIAATGYDHSLDR